MDEKKEKEKQILEKVYNKKNRHLYELIDDKCEKPDFKLKDLKTGDIFGVEVTNMYYDQFSALLKEKPYIIQNMLKNGIPRKATGILKRQQVYIEFNQKWNYLGDTIDETFKKYDDYVDALVKTINVKSKKALEYDDKLSYIELFINDRENYLFFKSISDLAYLEKSEKLQKAIDDSSFERIYFFTVINKKEVLFLIGNMSSGPLALSDGEIIKHKKYMDEIYSNNVKIDR